MKKKIKRAVATGMSLAMGTVIMTSDVMVSPVMASQINGEKPYAVELYAASNASYNGLYYSTSVHMQQLLDMMDRVQILLFRRR